MRLVIIGVNLSVEAKTDLLNLKAKIPNEDDNIWFYDIRDSDLKKTLKRVRKKTQTFRKSEEGNDIMNFAFDRLISENLSES